MKRFRLGSNAATSSQRCIFAINWSEKNCRGTYLFPHFARCGAASPHCDSNSTPHSYSTLLLVLFDGCATGALLPPSKCYNSSWTTSKYIFQNLSTLSIIYTKQSSRLLTKFLFFSNLSLNLFFMDRFRYTPISIQLYLSILLVHYQIPRNLWNIIYFPSISMAVDLG